MIRRFEDRNKLIEALERQQILRGTTGVGEQLANVAELLQFEPEPKKNILIQQNNADNDLFLILAGRVSIEVNGREVATRQAGQHVGEMGVIDTSAPRCATVISIEQTVVAKIKERDFTPLADKHPVLWRQLALELADRLRQRGKHVKPPNPRPVVFVGSSKESLKPAREIQGHFSHDDMVMRLWTQGFRPSATAFENLERELAGADFAVLVLAADDLVESRDVLQDAPRDNVIWEHGFFTGGLGRGRVFIVRPRDVDLKLPSDWGGITILDYNPKGTDDDLADRLASAVNSIRKEINRMKVK
jgi:CRP/FNR family transcriptional regulator, cyclic AMP receptor protein